MITPPYDEMCGPSNPHRREVAFNTRPCGVPLEVLSR